MPFVQSKRPQLIQRTDRPGHTMPVNAVCHVEPEPSLDMGR